MSQQKIIQFINNNPRRAYSSRSLDTKYLQDTSNIPKKLDGLKRRKMLKKTIIKMNEQNFNKFNINIISAKPKKNSYVPFYHTKDIMELEQFVY